MHGDKDKDASAVTDSNELARLCCSELNGGIQIPFKEFVFCNYTGLIKHSQDAGVYWVGILDASDCILGWNFSTTRHNKYYNQFFLSLLSHC